MSANPSNLLFTIGHSNHDEQTFLDLLKKHEIQVVADVRSQPYSRHANHFSSTPIKHLLANADIQYVFLGKELGGRPDDEDCYDDQGHVLYDRLARSPLFLEGVERVEKGLAQYRVAMMCSEENPAECHRYLMVARVMADRGAGVRHIRADGRLQTNDQLRREQTGGQSFLFDELKEPPWRSIRSVLPKQPPELSSSG